MSWYVWCTWSFSEGVCVEGGGGMDISRVEFLEVGWRLSGLIVYFITSLQVEEVR